MMTKENLRDLFCKQLNSSQHWGDLSLFDEFFEANVCTPKGENRHPYADVLHEWVEGAEIENIENTNRPYLVQDAKTIVSGEYRIKPYKPVYEYQVCMYFADGTYEYTDRYFTVEEYIAFGLPPSCLLKEETKRERKQ